MNHHLLQKSLTRPSPENSPESSTILHHPDKPNSGKIPRRRLPRPNSPTSFLLVGSSSDNFAEVMSRSSTYHRQLFLLGLSSNSGRDDVIDTGGFSVEADFQGEPMQAPECLCHIYLPLSQRFAQTPIDPHSLAEWVKNLDNQAV